MQFKIRWDFYFSSVVEKKHWWYCAVVNRIQNVPLCINNVLERKQNENDL